MFFHSNDGIRNSSLMIRLLYSSKGWEEYLNHKSHQNFFSSMAPYCPLSPARSFLPLISAPTGFHNWDLVTRWAQLLITSNYYLPSTPKYRSTMRAELSELLQIEVVGVIFGTHKARSRWEITQPGLELKSDITYASFQFINLVAVFTFTMWVMPNSGYAPVHRM